MSFKKIGACWNSQKPDKNGKPFMNGIIDDDINLHKGQKVFIFMVDPAKRGPKSPIANLVVNVDGEQYQAPAPEPEPLPDPLPDDSEPPF